MTTDIDFPAARKNMIDCQLMTNGIHNEKLLEVFSAVPREAFLADDKKHLAYLDEDICIGQDKFLMEPVIFARMVKILDIGHDDSVLNIGDMTGYSSAILSCIATTVVTIDQDEILGQAVQDIWTGMEYCNIACLPGRYGKGMAEHAPYDAIFVNGAMHDVPESLLQQLNFGGRLIAVYKDKPNDMGKILVVQRQGDDSFSRVMHHDAATPFVSCFAPKDEFVF